MPLATSEDAVLGGRLLLRQPLRGHRVGHDAILLAAATAAESGEHAVEFGAGVGAAGLALALRVPGLRLTLVEVDPDLCALAQANAARNGLAERVRVLAADVEHLGDTGLIEADRVLMNPPFNDPRRHNVSPDPERRRAHVSDAGLLARWLASAAEVLREGGVLTLIWRADELQFVLAALKTAFGQARMLPILPRPDRPAIRVLLRAVKGAAWACTACRPLLLNDDAGKPTPQAEAVLRDAQTLVFE